MQAQSSRNSAASHTDLVGTAPSGIGGVQRRSTRRNGGAAFASAAASAAIALATVSVAGGIGGPPREFQKQQQQQQPLPSSAFRTTSNGAERTAHIPTLPAPSISSSSSLLPKKVGDNSPITATFSSSAESASASAAPPRHVFASLEEAMEKLTPPLANDDEQQLTSPAPSPSVGASFFAAAQQLSSDASSVRSDCVVQSGNACVKADGLAGATTNGGWLQLCPFFGADRVDALDGTDAACVSIKAYRVTESNAAVGTEATVGDASSGLRLTPNGAPTAFRINKKCSASGATASAGYVPCLPNIKKDNGENKGEEGADDILGLAVPLSMTVGYNTIVNVRAFLFTTGGTVSYAGKSFDVARNSFMIDLYSERYTYSDASAEKVSFEFIVRTRGAATNLNSLSTTYGTDDAAAIAEGIGAPAGGSIASLNSGLLRAPSRYTYVPLDGSYTNRPVPTTTLATTTRLTTTTKPIPSTTVPPITLPPTTTPAPTLRPVVTQKPVVVATTTAPGATVATTVAPPTTTAATTTRVATTTAAVPAGTTTAAVTVPPTTTTKAPTTVPPTTTAAATTAAASTTVPTTAPQTTTTTTPPQTSASGTEADKTLPQHRSFRGQVEGTEAEGAVTTDSAAVSTAPTVAAPTTAAPTPTPTTASSSSSTTTTTTTAPTPTTTPTTTKATTTAATTTTVTGAVTMTAPTPTATTTKAATATTTAPAATTSKATAFTVPTGVATTTVASTGDAGTTTDATEEETTTTTAEVTTTTKAPTTLAPTPAPTVPPPTTPTAFAEVNSYTEDGRFVYMHTAASSGAPIPNVITGGGPVRWGEATVALRDRQGTAGRVLTVTLNSRVRAFHYAAFVAAPAYDVENVYRNSAPARGTSTGLAAVGAALFSWAFVWLTLLLG